MVSVKKDSEQRPPNAAKGNDSPAQTNAREFNASLGRQMQSPTISQSAPAGLAGDVIEGADAIAEFLFGSKKYRRVYYLAESSRLPIFRLGSVLCARKSVLLEFISTQEGRVLLPGARLDSAAPPESDAAS
jgi:hypothetical protein